MIFWHLGITVLFARYAFRDPRMDLRWVLVGSILPDLIDKPIGSVLFNESLGTDRLIAHAVVFPVLSMAVVIAVTNRGTGLRKGLIGLVIGCLFHLVLDGAWSDPEAFWWPFFGVDFPLRAESAFGPLVRRMISDPLVWAGEAVGAAYLAYLWHSYLRREGGLRGFARSGRIPMP